VNASTKKRLLAVLERERKSLLETADMIEVVRGELDLHDDICCNATWAVDDAIAELKRLRPVKRRGPCGAF
jgi:hypothetical protein